MTNNIILLSILLKGKALEVPWTKIQKNRILSHYLCEGQRLFINEKDHRYYSIEFVEVSDLDDLYTCSEELVRILSSECIDAFQGQQDGAWRVTLFCDPKDIVSLYKLSPGFALALSNLNLGFKYSIFPGYENRGEYEETESYITVSLKTDSCFQQNRMFALKKCQNLEKIETYLKSLGYTPIDLVKYDNTQGWTSSLIKMICQSGNRKNSDHLAPRIDFFMGDIVAAGIYMDQELLKLVHSHKMNVELAVHLPGDVSRYVVINYPD